MKQRDLASNNRESRVDPNLLYGAALVFVSCFIGLLLWGNTDTAWAMILPLLAMALVFSRLRVLAVIVPVMVFFVLGLADFAVVGRGGRWSSGAVPLGICSLVMIATAMRFQTFVAAVFPAGSTTSHLVSPPAHNNDAPNGSVRGPSSFRIQELASLMLIPFAWVISMSVIGLVSGNLDSAKVEYGLLPQGLMVVKLTLALFAMFLICQSVLGYARWVTNDQNGASMHLRQEIWNWNGREQRMVAWGKPKHGSPG